MERNEPSPHPQMLEHLWRYFALHAGQRMSIFNFFLILASLVAAGLASCLQRNGPFQLFGALLGFTLALISFTFWKLDQRTSFLIKVAEEAIIELEGAFPIEASRIVSQEANRTKAAVSSGFILWRLWTYGTALRVVFFAMGLVGFGGAIWSLCRYVRWLN